jgi:hypothetical protein
MIAASYAEKHYRSAGSRFLRGAIEEFFQRELGRHFGVLIRTKIVEELMKLIGELTPAVDQLQPGQCLWLAVDATTRADSRQRKLRRVVLTLISQEDVERLSTGVTMKQIAGESIARIMREAYEQGALLSMRDIELLGWRNAGGLRKYRTAYEQEHACVLPHTGTLHDMGSCITHKGVIVAKALHEGLDPREVARQTNHSLKAVERYTKDYQRVKQCYEKQLNEQNISLVTGIARHVVRQYIKLIEDRPK